MDQRAGRQDGNHVDQISQVDHRYKKLDKSPRSHLDQTEHRFTRLDRIPRVRLGQLDQQGHGKLNSKFSSQGGLTSEISIDSHSNDQDCDNS